MNYVALLRGINVGGHKAVKMAELKALCGSLGFVGATTHLQSGNVLFASQDTDHARVAKKLQEAVQKKLAVESTVVVRAASELDRVIAKNPFRAEAERDPSRLIVMFLVEEPAKQAATALRGVSVGREVFRLAGSELYIYYPDGQGRSKLTNTLLERTLGLAGTARNWNTVTRLREMAKGLAGSLD